MEKKDYYNHYYKRGNRTFDERECLICNYAFIAPTSFKSITTCSDYCKKIKLSSQKRKGKYLLCRVCDKAIWCQPRKNHKYCSKECADIGTSIFTEERNLIRGTYKKYYGANWLSQRKKARIRDGCICQECGISEEDYGMELSVHHKKPFQLFDSYLDANVLENLTSICEPCHRKVHSGKNHHSYYLKNR